MIERLLEVNGAILDDIMSDQSRGLAERIDAQLTQSKKKRRRKNK